MREYIVIESILKNDLFRRYFPPFAGVLFIALFVSLGFWQLDRAAQKNNCSNNLPPVTLTPN